MRFAFVLMGLLALLGCGQTDSVQSAAAANIKFEVLTKGEVIDLPAHVADSGFTVFDFYADWCAPCTKLNRSLQDMKAVYGDQLHVYKLDIVNWDSNLAKSFKIRELPHLVVYKADGTMLAQGPSKNVLPALVSVLNHGGEI